MQKYAKKSTYGICGSSGSRHLPTTVYEDNYGYSMNYYQPMIDYIDVKNREGRENVQTPHLPWSCERSLPKYRPSNPISPYTSEEVVRLARKAATQAQRDLINARVAIRTPFSVKKSADAARVTKHILPDSVVERENSRYTQRLEEIRFKERRDYLRMLHHIQRMDESQVAISAELKRAIRGKSAHAITAALLAETDRNLKNARAEEEAYIATQQARASSVSRSVRAVSENRLLHTAHIEVLDDRMIDNLDYRVSSSLCNVKRQISNLNQKTAEFYSDSRCVPEKKCFLCRQVNEKHFLPQYYVHCFQ